MSMSSPKATSKKDLAAPSTPTTPVEEGYDGDVPIAVAKLEDGGEAEVRAVDGDGEGAGGFVRKNKKLLLVAGLLFGAGVVAVGAGVGSKNKAEANSGKKGSAMEGVTSENTNGNAADYGAEAYDEDCVEDDEAATDKVGSDGQTVDSANDGLVRLRKRRALIRASAKGILRGVDGPMDEEHRWDMELERGLETDGKTHKSEKEAKSTKTTKTTKTSKSKTTKCTKKSAVA